MKFVRDKFAYDFYRNFTVKIGFSTRKYSSLKSKSGTLKKKIFFYTKEGLPKDDKHVVGNIAGQKEKIVKQV